MACCQDEAWNEVERLPVGTVKAESSLSEDDFPEISRTFPLRVNEMLLLWLLLLWVVVAVLLFLLLLPVLVLFLAVVAVAV